MTDWDRDWLGGKGGGTGGKSPKPDSGWTYAEVVENARMLFAISEGPCEGLPNGLKSVKLNDTPVQNSDGSFNHRGISLALVHGTGSQPAIKGIDGTEVETGSGAEIKQNQPQFITISDSEVNSVRVKVSFQALQKIDPSTGKPTGTIVDFAIDLRATGDADYTTVISGNAGRVTNMTSGQLSIPFLIRMKGYGPWTIRIRRITADSTDSYTQDKSYLSGWTEIKDAKLRYPHTACLGLTLNARKFPSIPKVSLVYRGRKVKVPTNYNPTTRAYTGIWDGTFKEAWTNNPAWCFFDMATNARFGTGRYLTENNLDKWGLYTIGKYCDELVSDGKSGTEPRFTFNAYLTTPEEAFKVLAHMISVARAALYYGAGPDSPSTMLSAVQDVGSSPVALFSPSNVIDGKFNYTGTPLESRTTEVVVWWTDPEQGYKLTPIVVTADASSLARYGVQSKSTTAFGAVSRAQAIREGRRIIYTNLMETEVVTFSSGLQGITVFPGQMIQIKDPMVDQERMGGRLKTSTVSSLALDSTVTLQSGRSYVAWVQLSDGSIVSRSISTPAGTVSTVALSTPLPSIPLEEAQWQIVPSDTAPTRWRVVGIKESKTTDELSYEITAIVSNPAKYTLMDDPGTIVDAGTGFPVQFAAVSGLSLVCKASSDSISMHYSLQASWTTPAGAVASAVIQKDGGPWMPMVMDASGNGAVFDDTKGGVFRVMVMASYAGGPSNPAYATCTVAYIIPTTPTSLAFSFL